MCVHVSIYVDMLVWCVYLSVCVCVCVWMGGEGDAYACA